MVRPDKIIREFEGLRLDAYQDQAGVWTIGYGHTGPDVQPGMTIAKKEADRLLREDIAWAEKLFDETVTAPVNGEIRAACVSLIFNIGPDAWRGSTALRRLNARDYAGAAEAITWWNKVTVDGEKVKSRGLVRRREAEREVFMDGVALLADDARGPATGGEQKNPAKGESLTMNTSLAGALASGAAAAINAFNGMDWRVAVPLIVVGCLFAYLAFNRWMEAKVGEH